MIPPAPERFWPDEADTLLLTAALHPDAARARAAWRDWDDPQRFEAATWPMLRIFPAMARRLPELGLDSDLLPRLAGVRRFLWTKSRLLHRAVLPALGGLHAAGVTPMLLKGAARVALDPKETAERYSHDVDVLVPTPAWATAVEVMYAQGMEPALKLTREEVLGMRHRFHGIGFSKAEAQLDLHLFALKRNRCEGDDDGLWARSLPAVFGGVPVRAPGAEDRLVMAVGHGLLTSPGRVTNWVFDAVAALSRPGFDWDLVQRELVERGLSAFGAAGLRFLRARLDQPVPEALIEALEADVTAILAEEMICLHEAYWARSPREHAVLHFADLERARRAAGRLPPAPPPLRRDTACADALILPPTRQTAEMAAIPVPDWPGRRDRLRLDIEIEVAPAPPGQSLMIELTCFERHSSCLEQRIVKTATGRCALRFDLPAELLVMRRPERLTLAAWYVSRQGRMTTTAIPAARYRWWAA
ncbi:nucleotidyltransferase family protein [Falsiroseomonas sp.]|uniref:nucleotidyltransferase family protein n=1 Tax=Falsiroseomonas sp. TaxID=2870721 RepID=UPI0034A3AD3F